MPNSLLSELIPCQLLIQQSARAIELTPHQIEKGLIEVPKIRQILQGVKKGNQVEKHINALMARDRGLIYFKAGIPKARHGLKFAALTEIERLAVIDAMREIRELSRGFPVLLSDDDAKVSE